MEHEMCDGGRHRKLFYSVSPTLCKFPGADPGFFLGGDALVSCSTSTPINHIVFFFGEYQLYQKTADHLRGGGGGVHTPCTLPLDPPLVSHASTALRLLSIAKKMRKYNACSAGQHS